MSEAYDWSKAKVGDQVWMGPDSWDNQGWYGVIESITPSGREGIAGRALVVPVNKTQPEYSLTYVDVPAVLMP
jgi:hypothetical protein